MSQGLTISAKDLDVVRTISTTLTCFASHLSAAVRAELAEGLVKQVATLELLLLHPQNCRELPNGQHGDAATFGEIITAVRPGAIVDNGTYNSISRQCFVDYFGAKIWICKTKRIFWSQAFICSVNFLNVYLKLSDPCAFARIVSSASARHHSILHSGLLGNHIPPKAELQIVFRAQAVAVILSSNVGVPVDPGYLSENCDPSRTRGQANDNILITSVSRVEVSEP